MILKSPENFESSELRKLCLFEILHVFPNRVSLLAESSEEILSEIIEQLQVENHLAFLAEIFTVCSLHRSVQIPVVRYNTYVYNFMF